MQFSQVRQYVVGLLKASFANKAALDKIGEDQNGNLTYDGTAVGGGDSETITQQDIEDAIAADVLAILADDEEEQEEEEQEEQPGE